MYPQALNLTDRKTKCDLGELEVRVRYGPIKRAMRDQKARWGRYKVKCCVKLCLRRVGLPEDVEKEILKGL